MTCSCNQHSPFHWKENPRPSIFADDPAFKAKTNSALTSGQIMTEVVKKKRAENANHGTIYGLVKEREDAVIRSKLFHIYSKAGA